MSVNLRWNQLTGDHFTVVHCTGTVCSYRHEVYKNGNSEMDWGHLDIKSQGARKS